MLACARPRVLLSQAGTGRLQLQLAPRPRRHLRAAGLQLGLCAGRPARHGLSRLYHTAVPVAGRRAACVAPSSAAGSAAAIAALLVAARARHGHGAARCENREFNRQNGLHWSTPAANQQVRRRVRCAEYDRAATATAVVQQE